MQRLDALLQADILTYETETTDYVANGHVRYQDAGMLMAADHAHGTTTPSVTYLDNVRYQMLDKRGNGVAATVNQTDPDHSKMTLGTYSTCDPSERQWEMRADDIAIDQVQNKGSGHDVTLYYNDVPFFWFPYLSWPINEDRQSGFLAPSFGYSESRGLKIMLPYYLDLAPNYDATLKPVEFSKRGQMLDGEFRYLSSADRLLLDFGYIPHDDVTDESRGYVRLQDWATFSSDWGAKVDIHHVSDNEYLHDYGDSFLTTAVSLLRSSAYLNGRGDWWKASIGGDTWEVTDPSLEPYCTGLPSPKLCSNPAVFKPYTRLPRLTFNARQAGRRVRSGREFRVREFPALLLGDRAALRCVSIYCLSDRDRGLFSAPGAGLSADHVRPVRSEFFRFQPGLTSRSPSRNVPIFSLDSGLIFEREPNLFGTALTQTLEPRLYYLRVPYRNQSNLPIFDTQLPSFDFPEPVPHQHVSSARIGRSMRTTSPSR